MNGNAKKVKEIRVCITEIVDMVCGHGPGKFRHPAQISDVMIIIVTIVQRVCVSSCDSVMTLCYPSMHLCPAFNVTVRPPIDTQAPLRNWSRVSSCVSVMALYILLVTCSSTAGIVCIMVVLKLNCTYLEHMTIAAAQMTKQL